MFSSIFYPYSSLNASGHVYLIFINRLNVSGFGLEAILDGAMYQRGSQFQREKQREKQSFNRAVVIFCVSNWPSEATDILSQMLSMWWKTVAGTLHRASESPPRRCPGSRGLPTSNRVSEGITHSCLLVKIGHLCKHRILVVHCSCSHYPILSGLETKEADVSHAGFMILVWRLVKMGTHSFYKVTTELWNDAWNGKNGNNFALNAPGLKITDMDSHSKWW